jgi:hypothetical protein
VQKAICATFAVTTRARATTVEEAPEAAPEAALEPAQLVDEYDVPDLFSDTDSEVSEPPATMPDEDIPGDAHRDVTPEATPEPEAEAPEEPLENLIAEAYANDELVQAMIKAVNEGLPRLPAPIRSQGVKLSMADLTVRDNRLWVNERLYIPESDRLRQRIIETHHRPTTAGHPGRKGTYRKVILHYYWPRMRDDCKRYSDYCRTCARSRARNTQKQGLLRPLPIPERKWLDISMDLAEDLPPCTLNNRTYRHVLIVVGRLTKQRIFEPLQTKETSELVEVMHRRVFCEFGLPRSIISDRGSAFISHFWRRYCARHHVSVKLSSANHPETDGQSENAVKGLKNYLRAYINYAQDDWAWFLPDA